MRAGLGCHQNFANRWVREDVTQKFGENCLLIAKVTRTALPGVPSILLHKEDYYVNYLFFSSIILRA